MLIKKLFMKKIVTRYGMYGVAVMCILLIPEFFIFKNNHNWDLQEIIGYTTIVLSLAFVFFGIRQWRDKYNAGQLSFWKGIGIGSLISLFPAVAFGLLSWVEGLVDPEWQNEYYAHHIENVKRTTPPAELQAALKEIADQREMFSGPIAQFGFMFITVFVIGFIISIISALILRRNKPLAQ
jgi:hypothetical protein